MHLLHICFTCSVEKFGPAPSLDRSVSRPICAHVFDKCNLQLNPVPLACPLRKKKTKTNKPFPGIYRINQDSSKNTDTVLKLLQ